MYQSTKFHLIHSYFNYDRDIFQSNLVSFNWGRFYGSLDVNDAWDILFDKILLESSRFCPIQEFFIWKDHPPWFNNDIIELSANRDALYRDAMRLNDNNLLIEARKLKNLVKHWLVTIKNEYFLNELKKNESVVKKFWRTFDQLTNKHIKSTIEKIKSPTSGAYLDPLESAETLNQFYLTITDSLVRKLPDLPNVPLIDVNHT